MITPARSTVPVEHKDIYRITQRTFFDRCNPVAGHGEQISRREMEGVIAINRDGYVVLNPYLQKNIDLKPKWESERATGETCYPVEFIIDLLENERPVDGNDITTLGPANYFRFYLGVTANGKQMDVMLRVNFPVIADNTGKLVGGRNLDIYYATKLSAKVPASASRIENVDLDYCVRVALRHNISQAEFGDYLDNFWEDIQVPGAYIISWPVIEAITENSENDSMRFEFAWDENDRTNNNVQVGLTCDPDAERKFIDTTSNYSFPLMRGINKINPVGQMRFYKGLFSDNDFTILIESIGLNGHRDYYDISNEHP